MFAANEASQNAGTEAVRASGFATHPAPTFRQQLTTVLVGIAAERGEAWEPIAAMIDQEP